VSGALPVDGGDAEHVIDEFRRRGVDDEALADQLQVEGAQAFDKAWHDLLDCIAAKSEALNSAAPRRN
jgi:transaldolase